MRRLRDLEGPDDSGVAELARLVRSVGDLEPPHGAQERVRDSLAKHARSLAPWRKPAAADHDGDGESDARRPVIRHYRVTGVLGRGGMGTVYAAEQELLHRPVAIKLLSPELSQDQDIVLRLFNEARAATAIRHPGIVEIHDVGWTTEGEAFVVMELLDGETLAHRLARGRLPWRSALAVARQIAGALSAAHAAGIVHRDLKPDNIFLSPDPELPSGERIKLLDFGIAKLSAVANSGPSLHLTGDHAVIGTPMYMAPEQCRGVAVDHRADLYALGCVVFALCAGRPPFAGETTGDVLAAQITSPPPTLAAEGVEAPAAVEQLVQHLLAKSPEQRTQTAAELISAIDAITTGPLLRTASSAPRIEAVPTVALPVSITTLSGAATSRGQPTLQRRRRTVATYAVIAAIALIAASAVKLQSREVGPPAVLPLPAAAQPLDAGTQAPMAAVPQLSQVPRAPDTQLPTGWGRGWKAVDAHTAAAAGAPPGSVLITSAKGGDCPHGFVCLYQNARYSGVGIGISQGGSIANLQGIACPDCKNGTHGNDGTFAGQMSSWHNNTDQLSCWYYGKSFAGRSVKMSAQIKHHNTSPDNNDRAVSVGPCQ